MLRASLALMLLGASAAVLAQNGRGIANDASTSCQDLNDRAVAERTPVAAGDAVRLGDTDYRLYW